MKPKPLHGFTPADLRAFGEGRKTQYRVPVKFNDSKYCAPLPHVEYARDGMPIWFSSEPTDQIRQSDYFDNGYPCPLGKPGDRLFISEPFAIESFGAGVAQIRYAVDGHRGKSAGNSDTGLPNRLGLVPATRMPAHCARYWCEIVAVRVERVAAISEADARAEGCERNLYVCPACGKIDEVMATHRKDNWGHWEKGTCTLGDVHGYSQWHLECSQCGKWSDMKEAPAKDCFAEAWNARHGAGAWERNDWCWCLELKKVEGAR